MFVSGTEVFVGEGGTASRTFGPFEYRPVLLPSPSASVLLRALMTGSATVPGGRAIAL